MKPIDATDPQINAALIRENNRLHEIIRIQQEQLQAVTAQANQVPKLIDLINNSRHQTTPPDRILYVAPNGYTAEIWIGFTGDELASYLDFNFRRHQRHQTKGELQA